MIEVYYIINKKDLVVLEQVSNTGGYVAFSGTNTITGSSSSATLTPSSTTETVTLPNSNTLSLTTGYQIQNYNQIVETLSI